MIEAKHSKLKYMAYNTKFKQLGDCAVKLECGENSSDYITWYNL